MSFFYGLFGELISHPWIAFLIAAVLGVMGRVRARALTWIAAAIWLLYGLYETGIRLRLLCSGECDIRIDLLVIYPLLAAVSVIALLNFCLGSRSSGTQSAFD